MIGLVLASFLIRELWKRKEPFHWNGVDIGVLLFVVYDGISTFKFGMGIGQLQLSVCSLLYYGILRIWCDRVERWRALLSVYSFCIGVFSLLFFSYFFLFRETILGLDFSDLYDFRFLLRPLGVPNNEWASLQFLFGGIIVVAYTFCQGKKIQICLVGIGGLILLQILASFSRGMYLSLFLLSISVFFLIRRNLWSKKGIRVVGGVTLLIFLFSFCFRSEVTKTLKMSETVSQQRSLNSRLDIWEVTNDIVREHLWGCGNGNYLIVMDRYLQGEKAVEARTSYAINLISQLLVEKGWLGLILYFGVFVFLFVYVIRGRDLISCWAFLFLIVFLFREQSFSAFFCSARVRWLFFTLVAVCLFPLKEKKIFLSGHLYAFGKFCLVLLLIVLSVWGYSMFRKYWREQNELFLQALEQKRFAEVELRKKQLIEMPYVLNRALYEWQFYQEGAPNGEIEMFRREAQMYLRIAKEQQPYDIQLDFYKEWMWERDLRWFVNNYPHKLLFRWRWYEQVNRKMEPEKAIERLVSCIWLNPQIMKTDYWGKLKKQEPYFVQQVERVLRTQLRMKTDLDPTVLAKRGSVALILEELDEAEFYLTKALKQLPNLPMAWYNLGCVKEQQGKMEQALLYKKRGIVLGTQVIFPGDDWKRYLQTGLRSKEEQNINYLLNESYHFYFQLWYGCRLLGL